MEVVTSGDRPAPLLRIVPTKKRTHDETHTDVIAYGFRAMHGAEEAVMRAGCHVGKGGRCPEEEREEGMEGVLGRRSANADRPFFLRRV